MTDMKELYDFIDRLAENNNREWFAANKPEYERVRTGWIKELQTLIDKLAVYDTSLAHLDAKDCLYRIYRDTRFSPDKTPYKTYFSALLTPIGRRGDRAGYYIHIGHEESILCGGYWCCDNKVLKKLRKAVIDNVDEFREITETEGVLRYYPEWYGPKLKTAPSGYDRNHPDIDLLRLMHFAKETSMPREFFCTAGWQNKAAEILALLKPLNDFINYSLNE